MIISSLRGAFDAVRQSRMRSLFFNLAHPGLLHRLVMTTASHEIVKIFKASL
jgi:hypothetical protein